MPLHKYRVKFSAIAWVTAHDEDQAKATIESCDGAYLDNMTVDKIAATAAELTDEPVGLHDVDLHRMNDIDCADCVDAGDDGE